jgi:hypothetical protein
MAALNDPNLPQLRASPLALRQRSDTGLNQFPFAISSVNRLPSRKTLC